MGIPVTRDFQDDPRARHTMGQLPWLYSELLKRQLLPGAGGLAPAQQPGKWVPVCREPLAQQPLPSLHKGSLENTWEAGALFGSSWRAEDAPSRQAVGTSDSLGAQQMSRGAGGSAMALTSWPTVPARAGSSLPAFAEVIDQDQHPQGDEKVCSDDPCHGQGIQLLAVGTHCRGVRGGGDAQSQGRPRPRSPGCWHRATGSWEGEKGKLKGKGRFLLPKMGPRTLLLPTQSGKGLGSTTFTHPSTENELSAPKTCHWNVQGEGSALTSGIQVQLMLLITQGTTQVGRSAVMVLYNEFPLLGVPFFPSRVPLDAVVLQGTRDCHRGARNLHQEFPLGRQTNEKGNQGENSNISTSFLVSCGFYITLNS